MSQAPFEDKTPGNEYWRTLIGPMVDAGNAVFATDYEGMGAPGNYTYLLRTQAFDVLDGMRAALFFRPQTLDALNLAVLGHSEGGYVTDLSQSWIQTYPDLSSPEDWYTEVGATEIPAAAELCQGAQLAALDQPFHTYFNRSVPVELSRIPATEQPMYSTSAIPILIQQGSKDTSVVPQVSRAMAVQGCALGNIVDYQEFPNDVHRSVQYTSRTQYLEWLAARFNGEPVDSFYRGW